MNYSFVVDSSYKPFSLQEMLVPFTAYKEEYEKADAAFNELSEKADTFKYLSRTLPENSKARKLYEDYANELKTQAADLSNNGLTRANKTALTSLKRRYSGEIGELARADEAMKEEKKLRRTMDTQDSSRLYATDNLSIDDFLDGGTPNLYGISGNELYTRGAAAGKAASSRVFDFGEGNITLGGYYRDLVSKMGYSPETLAKFREDINSNPELSAYVDNIERERGTDVNLTGVSRKRARQSIINGIIDGAVYQESHNPQRDLGVVNADTKYTTNVQLATQGMFYDDKTGTISYDSTKDPAVSKAVAIAKEKSKQSGNRNSRTSAYNTRNKDTVLVGKSGQRYLMKGETGAGIPIDGTPMNSRVLSDAEVLSMLDPDGSGNISEDYSMIKNAIGNGDLSDYEISIIPSGTEIDSESIWSKNGTTKEDIFVLKPRETKRAATDVSSNGEYEVNDIPK